MREARALVVALVLLAYCGWGHQKPTQLLGGQSEPLSREGNEDLFLQAEKLALKYHPNGPDSNCTVDSLSDLRTQVLSGIKFFFTATFSCGKEHQWCQMEVYEPPAAADHHLQHLTQKVQCVA